MISAWPVAEVRSIVEKERTHTEPAAQPQSIIGKGEYWRIYRVRRITDWPATVAPGNRASDGA